LNKNKIDEMRNTFSDNFTFWTGDFNFKNNTPEEYHNLIEYKSTLHLVPTPTNDTTNVKNRKFRKKFLCPMGRYKKERWRLYNFIKNNDDLEKNFYYSFNCIDSIEGYPTKLLESKNTRIAKEREIWSNRYFNKLHTTSFCSVVSETLFNNDNPVKFISEKIYRPITSQQPFIVLGQSNVLSILKQFGFKTFDKWWDESYDQELSEEIRFNKIFKLINELNKKSLDELHEIYLEMIPILKHNFDLVHNISKQEFSCKSFMQNRNYPECELGDLIL